MIARQNEGLLALDEGGVRFKISFPDDSGPAQNASAAARYADLAATDSGRYLAYRFWGGKITVCSTVDGSINGSAPAELHDEIEAVSTDGRYVFLVNRGKEPGVWGPEKLVDERVAIVDTATGERLRIEPVQALVTGSEQRLGLVRWSPHDQAFLLQLEAEPCAVYVYHPAEDSLAKVAGIDAFWGVSDTGVIVGATGSRRLQGGGLDFGQPVVWDGGRLEPVHGSGPWGHGVTTISADGSTLVLEVVSSNDEETIMGWQSFRRTGKEWRPDSPVYTHPLNYARLSGISKDNRTVWGMRLAGSPRDYGYQVVSLDTQTGRWNEWFGETDLRDDSQEFCVEIPLFR